MERVNIKGDRYGRLTVLDRAENSKRGRTQWLCKCDCGRMTTVTTDRLRGGVTRSCGCLHNEVIARVNYRHGESFHSANTRLYHIWINMRQRCSNPKNGSYMDYGARGITVCQEWDDYLAFKSWAETHGYSNALTIDRIDNSRGYSPENCRWADHYAQNNNKRCNHAITFSGVTKNLSQWERKLRISKGAFGSYIAKHGEQAAIAYYLKKHHIELKKAA